MPEDNDTSSAQRRQEIAAILAAGLLRYRRLARLDAQTAAESTSCPHNCLELPGQSRLSVPTFPAVNVCESQR